MYWSDSDPLETEPHSALIGSETAELVVVGAGYTGLWTALLAKEAHPERDVVIIEQRETGAGASGRNGGFVVASLTHGFQNGKNRWPDEMGTIERMGRENLAAIEETIHRYGIECDWERTGEIKVAAEPWQLVGMEEEAAERNELGDDVEFLDADTVRRMIHSPTYHGAVFDHDGTALVDPARLVWGLERACISLGVRIYENSKVQWLEREKNGIRVHTTFGEIFTDKVALATNVFKPVVRSARKYIVPVYDTIRLVGTDAKVSATQEINSTTTDKRVMVEFSGAVGMRFITPVAKFDRSMNSVRNHLPLSLHISLRHSHNLKASDLHTCGVAPSIRAHGSRLFGDSPAISAWAMPSDIPGSV
jgi:2-polyprenyl-6-methoxyphenol hydroxylase-like FAD-dependent oxidoreductase